MTSTSEKGPAWRWIDLITWSPVPALIVVYVHGDLADVYSSNRLPKKPPHYSEMPEPMD